MFSPRWLVAALLLATAGCAVAPPTVSQPLNEDQLLFLLLSGVAAQQATVSQGLSAQSNQMWQNQWQQQHDFWLLNSQPNVIQ